MNKYIYCFSHGLFIGLLIASIVIGVVSIKQTSSKCESNLLNEYSNNMHLMNDDLQHIITQLHQMNKLLHNDLHENIQLIMKCKGIYMHICCNNNNHCNQYILHLFE